MTTKIPNLEINKFTAPDNTIPVSAIQDSSVRRFLTDAEKTKITDLPDNTSLQNDLNAKANASDVYTKIESDTNFEPKNNNIQLHILDTANPHGVTKVQVGLGNVDNTSDISKPVSTATQNALNAKQDTLVSGTNIKTINNQSVLGLGNINITSSTLDINTLPSKATVNDNDLVVIGDSEAGLTTKTITALQFKNQNSAEMLVEIGSKIQTEFTSTIDIPIDLENYATNYISIASLSNDTNNIRVRGSFLKQNLTALTSQFKWSGFSSNENNVNVNEYNVTTNYFPIASERMASGLASSNISTHNITIQKQSTGNYFIRDEYNYLGSDNYITSGNVNIQGSVLQDVGTMISGVYSQSGVYQAGFDSASNQNLLKDNNTSTIAATLSTTNEFIMLDLQVPQLVASVKITSPDTTGGWGGGSYTNGAVLQYSNDGINWTAFTTLSGFTTATTQVYFINVNARYIRVIKATSYVALSEFTAHSIQAAVEITPTFLRIYASSGLIKATSYIYGLKSTSIQGGGTNAVIQPVSAIQPATSIQAISETQPPKYV